jgi:hypothetical protein
MDSARLGRGEGIAGVCAVLLFIVMFFGWFSLPGPDEVATPFGGTVSFDASANAWQSYDFTDLLLLVTIVVAVGGAIATLMARDVSPPVAVSALTAGLGILSFVFVLFSIINTPSEAGIDLDREFWVFVGLVLTAGIAFGGWMAMQEEGTSFGDQADRIQDRAAATPPPTTGADPVPPPAAPPAAGEPSAPPPQQPPPPPQQQPPSSGGTPS